MLVLKLLEILHKYSSDAKLEMCRIRFGDIATNLPFVNHSALYSFINEIKTLPWIDSVELHKSGFLNIKLNIKYIIEHNLSELAQIPRISNSDKYNFEYISPNPTGNIHLAHIMSAIKGLTIYRLLKYVGYNIDSELIWNNCGTQILQFYSSVLYYIQNTSEVELDPKIFNQKYELYYHGEYVKEFANYIIQNNLYSMLDDPQNILQMQIKDIKKDLTRLDIKMNCEVYESDFINNVQQTLNIIKDYIYVKDGATYAVYSPEPDKDKVIIKSNGTSTYFCNDISYHLNKYSRGYNKLIIVLGEDHMGHYPQLQYILSKLNISLEACILRNIQIIKNGEALKLSKRNGNVITLDDLLNIITLNELKIILLSFNASTSRAINIDLIQEQNIEFIISHTFTRIKEIISESQQFSDPESFYLDEYRSVVQKLFFFPTIIHQLANNRDAHGVFDYLWSTIRLARQLINKYTKSNIPQEVITLLSTTYNMINDLLFITNIKL